MVDRALSGRKSWHLQGGHDGHYRGEMHIRQLLSHLKHIDQAAVCIELPEIDVLEI